MEVRKYRSIGSLNKDFFFFRVFLHSPWSLIPPSPILFPFTKPEQELSLKFRFLGFAFDTAPLMTLGKLRSKGHEQ